MSIEEDKSNFLCSAMEWICDSYSADFRYLARREGEQLIILEALLGFAPLAFEIETNFRFENDLLVAGQYQFSKLTTQQSISLLEGAAKGEISIEGELFTLSDKEPLRFYSEMNNRDRWACDLHLKVTSHQRISPLSPGEILGIDNMLRRNTPPFDGVADLVSWLGLSDPLSGHRESFIDVRMLPPVDIIYPECSLNNNRLTITLHAHPKLDVTRVGLAIKTTPFVALENRKQVSSKINWESDKGGRTVGTIEINLEQTDNALAMLTLGESTIRRQWYSDPDKASNRQLLAVQKFDKDLRMIKQAVLDDPTNGSRFELGIASLLFIHGFSPVVQLETDSPDLIVTTPEGTLAIVECTLRIADIHAKLGKLVDRRGLLIKSMSDSGHSSRVDAFLVCALPKDQIATQSDIAMQEHVSLITKEDIEALFNSVRFPKNPDKLLDDALEQLDSKVNGIAE